jgi:tRNA G10  N-methylase Trm11
MNKYYIQLGNTPELSLQELSSVLGEGRVTKIATHLALVELKNDDSAKELIDVLGGSVKIIKEILRFKGNEKTDKDGKVREVVAEEKIIETVADHLLTKEGKKVHFGFSEYGRDHLPKIEYYEIKSKIEQGGKSARFVEGSRLGLSAAVLIHKKRIVEIYIIQIADGVFMGETLATQNIDLWTLKDRGKPYFDKKKGMLPPKVAKMMLNIALGDNPPVDDRKNILLDPFVGTGTVLIEALMENIDVLGSDIDPLAVKGTKQNLEWLRGEYKIEATSKVMMFDVTKIPPQKNLVQYIVTEPFLGKPRPNPSKLPFIFKGLAKMYLGAFKHWRKLLADNAVVVIVFPVVTIKNRNGKIIEYNLDKLIDKLSALGYTTLSKPILYHRPNAVVQRQIYRFKFKK